MSKKNIQGGTIVPTGASPPADAGFFRRSQNVVGVVGSMVSINPQTRVETNVVTGANHQSEHEALGTWDDLNFAASGINPTGAAGEAAIDQNTGSRVFSGTVDNVLTATAQMPHRWKEGSEVRPHIHLRFPTAAVANTRWKFEYDMANVNGDFANDYGTYTTLGTVTAANPNNARRSVVVPLGALTMTGMKVSAQIPWKLTRLANSDAADNHAADVILTDIDFHYQSDSPGSRQEFVK